MANKNSKKSKSVNTSKSKKSSVKSDSVASDNVNIETETLKPNNRHNSGRKSAMEFVDLDKLTEYASQPIENYKIAEALDMAVSTFYKLLSTNADFKQAYEQGIDNRKYTLEKALLKRAEGFTATESQTVVTDDPEKGRIVKNTVTQKNYVPDSTALIFSLKNLYSDKYKDRVESVNTVNINVNQIQNLPDEELLKYANTELLDNIDYEVE